MALFRRAHDGLDRDAEFVSTINRLGTVHQAM
jgi:hypothetical protein